ncbi:cadherin-1-like [Dreissena polymorpha]|uniref:cadherin-1-like n=1 Tax=Dreissena polymorpha TaxID=45954 RepID=UPI002264103E|nr:cadherin-1-like [Dreissena polymorpha]
MMSNSPTTGFALLLVTGYIGTVLAAPPTVNDLPRNIYVGNLETQERYLYTLNVTDPDADAFACSHTITYNDSISTNREFVLREDTTTKEWKFYIRAGALPSPDNTKPYINTIECTDSNSGSSGRYNITVRAVHDELLTLPNIAGTANALKIDAISTLKGKTLKTASANSRGGNLVEYSLVSDPSFSPEFFTIDSSNGVIKANRDFKYLDSRYPTVYLTIKAHDTVDSIDVYETQIVQLTNQNTVPRIVNLDPGLADSQLESLALGSVLMTLTTEDPDASTTLTYAFSCVPPDGKNTFTIDTNGNVKLAQALDYETVKTYTCGFNVSDGTATGGPFMYTLTVQDANEAPYFSDTMYYATTSEGAAGSVSFDPSFSCSDQDVTDVSKLTYAFKAANNSNRFAINTAGVMTFKENYDVDKNAMPSSVVLTVFCVDAGGTTGVKKTGSTQVTITIAVPC